MKTSFAKRFGAWLLAAALLLLVVAWWGRQVTDKSLLPGVYDATTRYSVETLEVLPTGRFRQTTTSASTGKSVTTAGPWTFDPADGSICFEEGFLLTLDGFGQHNPSHDQPAEGRVILPARTQFGRPQIGDVEYVLYHKRR